MGRKKKVEENAVLDTSDNGQNVETSQAPVVKKKRRRRRNKAEMAESSLAKNKQKLNKNEFLNMLAVKYNIPIADVHTVYDAFVNEIRESVCEGHDVSLTGFGTFTLKRHKGHPVQFEAKTDMVRDYVVLKFAASDVLITRIRKDYESGNAIPSDDFGKNKE